MTTRQDALLEIAQMMKAHGLTVADISAALTISPEQEAQKSGSIISRLFGYIGGILVFAGLCTFAGMMWDDLGAVGHIFLTLGIGFCAFVMAVTCTTRDNIERAATPLFLVAALLQPAGILVMMNEFSRGGDPAHGLLFMNLVMLTQQGLTFWSRQRTVLAFTSIIFGTSFFAIAFDLMEFGSTLIGFILGISLFCIAWTLDKSRHKPIAWVWYFIGSLSFMISLFDIVEGTPAEILFLGAGCGIIYLSTIARSRALLTVGTLSVLGYITYFTAEHFAGSIGWPFAMILIGFMLIGCGALAVRINNKYIKQRG